MNKKKRIKSKQIHSLIDKGFVIDFVGKLTKLMNHFKRNSQMLPPDIGLKHKMLQTFNSACKTI